MYIYALIILFVLMIIVLVILLVGSRMGNVSGGYREVYIDSITPKNVEYIDDVYGDKHMYAVKGSYYKDIHSDMQIQTIIKYGSISEYARLIQVLGKHINRKGFERANILRHMFSEKSDKRAYAELHKYFNRNEDARSLSQAQDVFRPLKYYIDKNNVVVNNYLDIGCGNGKITAHMKTLLGVDCAYCVEANKESHNADIKYDYIDNDTPIKLNYTDGQFDLITAYMSLHHVNRLDEMIVELGRVLKDDGILFIKEHDCWNAFDAMLIDVEHAIFMYGQESLDNYFINYKNYWGWDKAMSVCFKYVQSDYYYPAIRNEISPTRAFWCIYKKSDNRV